MESLILRLWFAPVIDLLVGLERGWREREAPVGAAARAGLIFIDREIVREPRDEPTICQFPRPEGQKTLLQAGAPTLRT
ncbi:hypothetical protein GOD35_27315 [Sinorhizobium medicae]|nr:hypothetical protein [Sinorhizobium medicae]MDX0635912.1 hypothetical protein [Sinorhizobium medicae]MDX0695696.1 hypothetical protein [Sinorhizobium medicae]MDX0745248.1 hypothetical protein [Sinorhizobium medicae]MDX0906873.1 hypothetical protein [Sinorhizobium medicae]